MGRKHQAELFLLYFADLFRHSLNLNKAFLGRNIKTFSLVSVIQNFNVEFENSVLLCYCSNLS